MSDVLIKYISESICEVSTDNYTLSELKYRMRFHPKNYYFTPLYKCGKWDGWIYLIKNQGRMAVGLIPMLCSKMKELNISFEIDNRYFPSYQILREDIVSYSRLLNITSKGMNITPRDYQIEGIFQALSNKRAVLLSATNSGKSLTLYVYVRYLIDILGLNKILLLVPNTMLVEQMYSDFIDYSTNNKWDVELNCQKIYSDIKNRDMTKKVHISTWQSLYTKDPELFHQYEAFICDEVHTAKGESIQSISANCINASFRLGCTGSLTGDNIDEYTIRGSFGSVHNIIDNKEMIAKKYSTPLEIKAILLKYNERLSQSFKYLNYQDEINFICECKERNAFIAKLVNSFSYKNTLILFDKIKHGMFLYKTIKSIFPDRKVFFISGDIKTEVRNRIKEYIDNSTERGLVLIATYQTFSTGINLKNLHNLVFASPFKSRVRLLQSLGRMLRKAQDKDGAITYDIVDDFSYKSYINSTLKHFTEYRLPEYDKSGFKCQIIKRVIESTINENKYIEKAEQEKEYRKKIKTY